MIKNSGQEVQRILEQTKDDIRAFLQNPPASSETHLSQDVVFDPVSGDAVFRESIAHTPPDTSVLYRQVVERPPAYNLAHGLVARWFDENAQDAVLTNNLWEDIGPDHPYYGHNFKPVDSAMHSADMAVSVPTLDDAGNNTIYLYEFRGDHEATVDIMSYPNTTTLLGIEATKLAPQVNAYLENPALFRMRAEADIWSRSISTIEAIAKIVTSEACDPHTAVIKHYQSVPVGELIGVHDSYSEEQPLNSLTLAQEAQSRIQTYLWFLAC